MKKTNLLITQTLNHAPTDPPRPMGKYVYQRVRPGLGNVASSPDASLQCRLHVVPLDPRTPAQLARRDHLRAAVVRWHETPVQDRGIWQALADRKNITLFNASVSDALTNYNLVGGILVPK